MNTRTPETPTVNLTDMADSLYDACTSLASDCTVTRIDELVARLKTAEQTLVRLRISMAGGHS